MDKRNGYNPLRWQCESEGCFNKKKRPKIEMFSDCFPGKISFGDVDGRVEINGNFLELEWKSYRGTIPMGQMIAFNHLIKGNNYTIFVVAGDAETMKVDAMQILRDGVNPAWRDCNFDELHGWISRWSAWAKKGGNL